MLCAAAKSSDACYGDSGGPMTVQVENAAIYSQNIDKASFEENGFT